MSSESLLDVAARVAPAPASREGANRVTWVKHYAALALAAYATFRAEIRTVPRNPEPGSRPDLGYLITAAVTATATAVALADQSGDAPKLIWDLTPEAGALNGEWEEWLADTLVRYGVNPGHIDPDLNPVDFDGALRTHGPSNQPYVCPDCGETAYLHFPECRQNSPAGIGRASTATWRPARPGDTPGGLVPEHGPTQPVVLVREPQISRRFPTRVVITDAGRRATTN